MAESSKKTKNFCWGTKVGAAQGWLRKGIAKISKGHNFNLMKDKEFNENRIDNRKITIKPFE